MKKQDERTAAVADFEEEEEEEEEAAGPLSKLLKQQTQTNSLLKRYLTKQEEEEELEEEERMRKQKEDEEELEDYEEVEKEAKLGQTNQGKAKKIGDKPGPFNFPTLDASAKYVSNDDEPDEEEAYPYPYPEEAKEVAKSFPYPYSSIGSKREEIVAKQLFNSNQEIARLNGQLAKMVSPEQVERMVNSRFQQKMMDEGFVSSTGAIPPLGQPTEIAKEDAPSDGPVELKKADEVATQVRGLTWEHIIATRQETDPAYHQFLGKSPGARIKGGM